MKADKRHFRAYFSTTDAAEKHKFEKELDQDEFAMDALEGFYLTPNSWSQFEAFDRKARRKKRLVKNWQLLSAVLISIVIGSLLIPTPEKKEDQQIEIRVTKPTVIKIHKQKDLQEMPARPIAAQISPKQVMVSMNAKVEQTIDRKEALERIQQIPMQRFEFQQQKKLSFPQKIGRELIIKNFRVLDYRYYRKENDAAGQSFSENELGEQTLRIPYLNLLNKAILDFSKADYKLALLHFDEILQTYSDDANALFYGAMSLYNLGQFEQAEGRFLKLQLIPFANFNEEGNWYLLHVYQKSKKEQAFNSLKKAIVEQNGFYAKKATEFNF